MKLRKISLQDSLEISINPEIETSTLDQKIESNVPQLDSAEATQRNIIIARQRNYVGVAINNVKLKQDLATLDNEQQRLIGMLIDGKTTHVFNEKKAVTYHRAVVSRDTEISKLEQDRELLTQQQIRTEGTQNQTGLIQEQESLKVDAKDTRIEDFLEDCRGYTINFFSLRYKNIDTLQKVMLQAEVSEEIRQNFDKRIEDIAKLKQELTDAIVEIKQLNITDFKVILEYIFEFDNKFLNVKTRWKDGIVKDFKIENATLKTSLDNSMPLPIAKERFRAGMDEIDERITEKYEALLINNNSIHAQLLDLLEERNLVIDDLRKQNEELLKPLQAVGTSDYALAANKIANYYHQNYGYKLDIIHWTENETGYSILFATRRNPGLTEEMLLPHNTQEQLAAFTNALQGTLPKFTFNYQHSTVTLDITLRKPVKKDSSKDDIDKIWIPASKFESYVKNWERIRITAGSTGGKSPTAKNLALAIMKGRKGQGEIRLYDPQHGSKKDFWNMPKAGTNHEDNVKGMAELCDELDSRTKNPGNHPFILYIFDEVDSTIAQERESNGYYYFRDKVTYSLKQASHQNIGAIYIGQACDASTIPGMSWSDWNNAIQLHIGANAGIWLDKAKTITGEDKTKLLEQYRKIQDYCDRKNEELGLDIFTDPGAYRFALAVPLTGLPKFIQLPDFDTYEYSDVMSTNAQNDLIPNILNEVQKEAKSMNTEVENKCVYCGSIHFRSKGERWLCLNSECGKSWSKKTKLSF